MYYPKLASIVDCFEIFVERPNPAKSRAEMYSHYKHHSTIKCLIACSPLGFISFLSTCWGGRASDLTIARESVFLAISIKLGGPVCWLTELHPSG